METEADLAKALRPAYEGFPVRDGGQRQGDSTAAHHDRHPLQELSVNARNPRQRARPEEPIVDEARRGVLRVQASQEAARKIKATAKKAQVAKEKLVVIHRDNHVETGD
ncbi:hypothetical protein MMC31_001478 [Peltigera leucophlebia]|nr:hypothetical protein [Peltigera leucophlebia]